jgi:hypothetical protein
MLAYRWHLDTGWMADYRGPMNHDGYYANAIQAERPWVSRGAGYRVDTSPRISHSQAPTIATCDRCKGL